MTSQDTGGVRLSHGRAADSPCRRGALVTVVAYGVAWMHCTRVGRHWRRVGGTSGRWGLRAVSTTLGQWIPTLVEQAYSRRDSLRSRSRVIASGPQRRRRAGDSGGGLVTEAPGRAARTPDSLLRGLVSTALTLPSLPPKNPAEIVGILRFLSGVPRRYGVNVSTVDTSDLPGPARPLPFGASSPTGQSTCPRRSALEPEGTSSTPTQRVAIEPAARAATAATSGGSDRRTGRSPRPSPPQGRTSAEIRPSWPHRCAHGTWRAAP